MSIIVIACDLLELFGSNILFKKVMDGLSLNTMTFQEARLILFVFAILTSAFMFSKVLRRVFAFRYSFKLKEDIRNHLFTLLLKQSNGFFNNNFVGTLNSKIGDITNNIGASLERTIDIISNLNAFFLSIIVFGYKNNHLMVFLILWTIIYLYANIKLSDKIEKQTEIATDIESACSGKIIDCFTNIVNIKNFSRERREKYNVKKHTKTILREKVKIIKTRINLDMINAVSKTIFSTVIIVSSLKMYFDKTITLGDLTFNISVSTQIFWWLKWALELSSENIEAYGKMKQAVETLIVEPTIKNKEDAKDLDIFNGKITFKNITFKY